MNPALTAHPLDLIAEDKKEWLESFDYIKDEYGAQAIHQLLRILLDHAMHCGIPFNEATLNTPYYNSIPLDEQPAYPGDLDMEKRIENILRWNAMAMVLQAYDAGEGVGGHIATYASAATMLEVGFNHCFRAKSADYGGDMVLIQPHSSPGIYARAMLEGRLTLKQAKNFRRELGEGGGLSSYPHPRSMPTFWDMPTASMGLSTVSAIYQARFAKYLESRGLKPKNGGKIWCFIGDGESDEPEVLGTINIAARERLDNLILVVNCNLQRLDGPVRGNGKIIQELERSFRGAGWQVIKVIWGSGWDPLLAEDHQGILRGRMEECRDGDYQRYSVLSGDRQREHWVEGSPALKQMMDSLSDEALQHIKRGGQDPKKIFAAMNKAQKNDGRPTVLLIKTVKGEGLDNTQGKNNAHQKKNLTPEERIHAAKAYGIPIDEAAAKSAEFYLPSSDSLEMRYLHERRLALGGYLPQREESCPTLSPPDPDLFQEFFQGSNDRKVSTTMVMVRLLTKLIRDKSIGRYIVPIVPDEARTFGMDSLIKEAGIYSVDGQRYTPVDAESILSYREAQEGQIWQEGSCEAGAMATFMAAGTAYAVHGIPCIPFYIYYSMFGFQRVGDLVWACGDMMARGFLLGGTAGRTTLNGEGLQHQDGHSLILASTIPSLKSYDPAFGYEVAVIIQEGFRRMYLAQEKIFYYLTLYNENYLMPPMLGKAQAQENLRQGILRGGYLWQPSQQKPDARDAVHLLASGALMTQAINAATLLESMGLACHIWSITSFTELARDAEHCERFNRLHANEPARIPEVTKMFSGQNGVCVAVTDYMKSLPASISQWMPLPYRCLGTDGVGVSEARGVLRDYFEVSERYLVATALHLLYEQGLIPQKQMMAHMASLGIPTEKADPVAR